MVSLILVILSITLTAATLFASLNYMPGWTSTVSDSYHLVRYGFIALEKAFLIQKTAEGEVVPEPTADADGGLAANFSSAYAYLPKAPKGYAWKYGANSNAYYFCMHPTSGSLGASEGQWRGLSRARTVLSDEQYFIVPGGEGACAEPTPATPQTAEVKAPPTAFPAPVSAVFLVWLKPVI